MRKYPPGALSQDLESVETSKLVGGRWCFLAHGIVHFVSVDYVANTVSGDITSIRRYQRLPCGEKAGDTTLCLAERTPQRLFLLASYISPILLTL
jgi:hypothetical protein